MRWKRITNPRILLACLSRLKVGDFYAKMMFYDRCVVKTKKFEENRGIFSGRFEEFLIYGSTSSRKNRRFSFMTTD
jgi:hypothetical protein